MKVCLVGSSGGHLTHLYMLKPFWEADCIKELFKSYDVTSLCCKAFKRSCLELEKDYSLFSNLNYGEDTLQSVEVYSNAQFSYIHLKHFNSIQVLMKYMFHVLMDGVLYLKHMQSSLILQNSRELLQVAQQVRNLFIMD